MQMINQINWKNHQNAIFCFPFCFSSFKMLLFVDVNIQSRNSCKFFNPLVPGVSYQSYLSIGTKAVRNSCDLTVSWY